jgi:hypothetical protein
MSCQACIDSQDGPQGSYYFRWKNANIELRGCREHITEVMDVLRDAHKRKDGIAILE